MEDLLQQIIDELQSINNTLDKVIDLLSDEDTEIDDQEMKDHE